MRAATRVNAEQASKLVMRKRPAMNTGKAAIGREASDKRTGRLRRGIGGGTHGRWEWTQHGKPRRWRGTRQPTTREGWVGSFGVAERPVLPLKPGNAGGGKGPWFESSVWKEKGTWGLARAYPTLKRSGDSRRRYMSSGLPVLLAQRQGVARRCNGRRLAGRPPQWRRCRGGRSDGSGHRSVWRGPVAWGTGAGPESGNLPA